MRTAFLYGLTGSLTRDPNQQTLVNEALERLGEEDSVDRVVLLATRADWEGITQATGGDLATAEAALAMARRLGSDRALVRAASAVADILVGSPRAAERVERMEEAVAAGRRGGIGRDLISSWQWDGPAWLELGDRAGAVAAAGECERAAKELRIDHTTVVLSGLRALLAMLDGRFDEADRLTEEAEVAAGSGDPSAGLGRFAVLVGIARERGDYSEFLPQLEMLGMLPELPGLRAEVGYAYLTAGRTDDAAGHSRRVRGRRLPRCTEQLGAPVDVARPHRAHHGSGNE